MKLMKKTIVYNNIISFIACRIFKYRMKCRIEKREETELNIHYHVKSELGALESMLKRAKIKYDYYLATKLSHIF